MYRKSITNYTPYMNTLITSPTYGFSTSPRSHLSSSSNYFFRDRSRVLQVDDGWRVLLAGSPGSEGSRGVLSCSRAFVCVHSDSEVPVSVASCSGSGLPSISVGQRRSRLRATRIDSIRGFPTSRISAPFGWSAVSR